MVSQRKRKRKTAGPKLAPLISTPIVAVLSDSDWEPFLELLTSRSRSEILRDRLDELLATYLGYLDGEARSPSSREVAAVLEDVARRVYRFAHDLFLLDIRSHNQEEQRLNTPEEVAADILANVLLKPERRASSERGYPG